MTTRLSPQDSQIIQRLFQAARPRQGPPAEPDAAEDFDWQAPCRLTPEQLAAIGSFACRAGEALGAMLTGLLRRQVTLSAAPPRQQYANAVRAQLAEAKCHCLALTVSGKPRGALAVPAKQAVGWVSALLGGSADEERELSSLEAALLQDMMTATVASLAAALGGQAEKKLGHGGTVVRGTASEQFDDAEELCLLSFEQDSSQVLAVVLAADAAESLIGGGAVAGGSPEETRKWLLGHLGELAVLATACLGPARATMREVLAMEAGDVLLLPCKTGQAVDLRVQGRLVARGVPAQCQGHYALQIVPQQ